MSVIPAYMVLRAAHYHLSHSASPNPALGRLRQENHELEANLSYTVRLCLKKKKQNQTKTNQTKPQNKTHYLIK
jgi:hypothetical protein